MIGQFQFQRGNGQPARANVVEFEQMVHVGPPVIVPPEVVNAQRRGARQPPVFNHVVMAHIPERLAFTRGNVMITYFMQLARFFYQRDIGIPIPFDQCEPTMPDDIYTAFHFTSHDNANRDMYIPFGRYTDINTLRTAFSNHYDNENMEIGNAQMDINVDPHANREDLWIQITQVHPSVQRQYNQVQRRNPLAAVGFPEEVVMEGGVLRQRERPEPPRRARLTRELRSLGLENVDVTAPRTLRRRTPQQTIRMTNARTGTTRGNISSRGQELITHPEGILLLRREEVIDELYTKRANCIRQVPVVEEDTCMLMAFIGAQCLNYEFEFDGKDNRWKLFDLNDLGPTTLHQQNREEVTKLPLSEVECQRVEANCHPDSRYFFLDSERIRGSDSRNWWIRLFNTYNPKDIPLTQEEIRMWTLVSLLLEQQLMARLVVNCREQIDFEGITDQEFLDRYDFTDIEQLCQVLADLMDVYISVYDLNGGANRFYGFMPSNRTPLEYLNFHYEQRLQEEGRGNGQKVSIRMVNLLYDNGHMHAITNIHEFQSKELTHVYRKYQFCPFCETVGGKGFRNKQDMDLHWVKEKCLAKALTVKNVKAFDMIAKSQGSIPASYQFHAKTKSCEYCCYRCHEPVASSTALLFHVCEAQVRSKKKDIISKKKIFSYDFEAAQISMESMGYPGQYYHVSNCVCMIPAYYDDIELQDHPDKNGRHFESETQFLQHIFDPVHKDTYKDSLFFAHNGGSYDVTFIIRYMENNRRSHTWLPRPGSHHKFISVTDSATGITFLDFRMFMSGSLASIGEAMKLPIAKGHFPHNFNNGFHTFYEGAVPPIDSSEDWWGLKWARSQKSIEETEEFHAELCEKYCTCPGEHTCDKPLWKLQEQMIYYCMLDVKLLAQCIVRFRAKVMDLTHSTSSWAHWKPVSIDPYWFVTTPQLCQGMLLMGYQKKPEQIYGCFGSDFCTIVSMEKKKRLGQTIEALYWLNSLPNRNHIFHRGNWAREYFSLEAQLYADGFDVDQKIAYVCIDCKVYACARCYQNTDLWDQPHPFFTNKTYCQVNQEHRQDILRRWQQAWGAPVDQNGPVLREVVIRSQCEIVEEMTWDNRYSRDYLKYAYEVGYNGSDGMKGGRTEVFKVLYERSEDPNEIINYDDVCSLYPYVCAFKEIPFGCPECILGEDIIPERLFSNDKTTKYWGFIHCKVLPNKEDLLGLLPNRRRGTRLDDTSERLMFTLEEQVGTWFIEEIEFALQFGYQVLEVYNIFHWSPEKRSDRKFRPYVDCFIRLKQQSEKWSKLGASCDRPSEEEKQEVANKLYQANGGIGMIDVNQVDENPVMRALMKLFLNNMWGKWAQKDSDTMMCTVYGAKQFYEIWDHPMVKKEGCTFREVCPNTCVYKAQIGLKEEFQKNAGRTNYFIGGAVTAHARIVLHTRMMLIGPERMIYCDTDSVIYIWSKDKPVLTSQGLGQWEKEKGKPIVKVMAIAPKFYILEYDDPEEDLAIKSKGIVMTLENRNALTKQRLLHMIFSTLSGHDVDLSKIHLQNFTIRTNTNTKNRLNFYVMCSLYNKKIVRMNITKRDVVVNQELEMQLTQHSWNTIKQINTVPIGYDHTR